MRKRLAITTIGVMAALASFGAASASAATEFGDPCTATTGTSSTEYTVFGLASPSSPLPLAAPSAGVITSWKLTLVTPPEGPIPAIIPQTLKVMRVNSATHTAQVVGEASGLVGSGVNTIPARIPVEAGDRLAVYGHGPITYKGSTSEVGTLLCEGSGGDLVGAIKGSVAPGASGPFEEVSEIRIPAVAVLEPDADHDGFGDETQDACPQSAATQAPCPAVTLSTSTQVKKGSVIVLATTNTPAPVTVKGLVKLGKGSKVTLNGGTKNLAPGAFGKFKLKFTKKLKAKLAQLSHKRSLTLRVTVTGTSLAGQVTTKKLKARLKGQG